MQEQQPVDRSMHASFVGDFLMQFNDQFQNIQYQRKNFKLITSPVEVKVEAASESLQIELIELQGAIALKSKYKETVIIQFYRQYLEDNGSYAGLVQHAKKKCCKFGSTYLCESLFSKLSYAKRRLRFRMTEQDLEGNI